MRKIPHISFAVLFIVLFAISVNAQQKTPPVIEWQRSIGGSNRDEPNSIQQTRDGGYIIAGSSWSFDGDVFEHHGDSNNPDFYNPDYWIVKLNDIGDIQWQRTLGGLNWDEAQSIQQTYDGGYIVAGTSSSNNIDVTGNHGSYDYWVVKLDSTGATQWQKAMGGSNYDYSYSIQQTRDSGYIVAGWSQSTNGDVKGHHGSSNSADYWIVKLDVRGDLKWQKSLGGSSWDAAYSIQQTQDDGYIVAGSSNSKDSNVTENHGAINCWIIKLDDSGVIQWQRSLGGNGNDVALCALQTQDGGYAIVGTTESNDGDVTMNYGFSDYWIVTLDNVGLVQWQISLGGGYYDEASFFQQTQNGGYVIVGKSYSTNGQITGNLGNSDYWIVKLNDTGSIQWQKSLGGSSWDNATSIQQTKDQGFIVAGRSSSNDGDVAEHHGSTDTSDFWIVKLSPEGTTSAEAEPATTSTITITPNSATSSATITLESDEAGACEVQIISVTGATLKEYSTHIGAGKQEIVLRDLESLPTGMYEVLVKRGGYGTLRTKLIIQ